MAIRLRNENPIDLDIKKEQNCEQLGNNTNPINSGASQNLFASNTVGLSSSCAAAASSSTATAAGSSSGGGFSAVA